MESLPAQWIRTEAEAYEAFLRSAETAVLIYKHSPICGLSEMALREMIRLAAQIPPGIAIYGIDVLAARPASGKVEEWTGIRHESPQVLFLRDRRCVWSASHRAIRAEALLEPMTAKGAE